MSWNKTCILPAALCVLLLPAVSAAQGSAGHTYAFIAPGGVSVGGATDATLHAGVGGEAFVYRNVAVGGEIGALWPVDGFREAVGLCSINGAYHFRNGNANRNAAPFLTGGYTLLFRNGTANLYNVGGGVDYWFKKDLGLRLEFRDHIHHFQFGGTAHFWQARLGLTFR